MMEHLLQGLSHVGWQTVVVVLVNTEEKEDLFAK